MRRLSLKRISQRDTRETQTWFLLKGYRQNKGLENILFVVGSNALLSGDEFAARCMRLKTTGHMKSGLVNWDQTVVRHHVWSHTEWIGLRTVCWWSTHTFVNAQWLHTILPYLVHKWPLQRSLCRNHSRPRQVTNRLFTCPSAETITAWRMVDLTLRYRKLFSSVCPPFGYMDRRKLLQTALYAVGQE